MVTLKSKLITFIAMIPLLFIFSSANAASQALKKPTGKDVTQQSFKIDTKATVLAKGQNHLPQQAGYQKETCSL